VYRLFDQSFQFTEIEFLQLRYFWRDNYVAVLLLWMLFEVVFVVLFGFVESVERFYSGRYGSVEEFFFSQFFDNQLSSCSLLIVMVEND
jgi:hypothetical protein